MSTVRVLFVSWQEPESRRIFPVARLMALPGGDYELVYIRAVRQAQAKGFVGLPGFEDVEKVYVERGLPALFEQRGPARGRPLSPEGSTAPANDTLDAAPITLFASRSDGKPADRLEVFAPPLATPSGEHWGIFLARGVARTPGAEEMIAVLEPHERMLLRAEPHNRYNPRALIILRSDQAPIGYVPDYLANEIAAAHGSAEQVQVQIQRVLRLNFAPASPLYQVACRYACGPELGRALFSSELYEPISSRATRLA